MKSKVDRDPPRRTHVRMLKEDPSVNSSSTLSEAPNRILEKTDIELPSRPTFRIDSDEPNV